MDMDIYAEARRAEWERLRQLADKRELTGVEADELIARYQSGASDISAMRTTYGDSTQTAALSVLMSKARMRFTRVRRNPLVTLQAVSYTHLRAHET